MSKMQGNHYKLSIPSTRESSNGEWISKNPFFDSSVAWQTKNKDLGTFVTYLKEKEFTFALLFWPWCKISSNREMERERDFVWTAPENNETFDLPSPLLHDPPSRLFSLFLHRALCCQLSLLSSRRFFSPLSFGLWPRFFFRFCGSPSSLSS